MENILNTLWLLHKLSYIRFNNIYNIYFSSTSSVTNPLTQNEIIFITTH